jgi:hypothetical protein
MGKNMGPVDRIDLQNSDDLTRPKSADHFIVEIAQGIKDKAANSFAVGQIDHIAIPRNWQQSTAPFESATGAFTAFKSDKAEDALLCFYSRGGSLDEISAKAFRDVLAKPPHHLSAEELTSLKSVLRERVPGENFKVTQAGTQAVNGQNVLFIEGQHTNADLHVAAIYINADGDGRSVQEAYFQAPSASYLQGRLQAMESFRSMRLNDNSMLNKLYLAPLK